MKKKQSYMDRGPRLVTTEEMKTDIQLGLVDKLISHAERDSASMIKEDSQSIEENSLYNHPQAPKLSTLRMGENTIKNIIKMKANGISRMHLNMSHT